MSEKVSSGTKSSKQKNPIINNYTMNTRFEDFLAIYWAYKDEIYKLVVMYVHILIFFIFDNFFPMSDFRIL